jgi:hypothetical protein
MSENGLSCQHNWKSQHLRWRETKLPETVGRKDFTGIFKSGPGTSPVAVKDEKMDTN